MILRCTAKALDLIGARAAALDSTPPSDDDWYLNLIWIDRRKCLLLTHAGTLFPIFVADIRKGDLRPLGPYVVGLIHELGHIFGAEHTQDTQSIMNENFDYRSQFDMKNRNVILSNRFCPFAK